MTRTSTADGPFGEASRGAAPPALTLAQLRTLELHEARAHARGRSEVIDLGDAVLLWDPDDRDPFFNRLSGVRVGGEGAAVDARLAELLGLFATRDRRAHVWPAAALGSPADLVRRLEADGFGDLGGTFWMLLPEPAAFRPAALPAGTSCARLADAPPDRRRAVAEAAARVMTEAFGGDDEMAADLAADIDRTGAPWDTCVLFDGDDPVAAGRRYTADGITYVSSIGTRVAWRGRGYGAALTSLLVADGWAAGATMAHLGVEALNPRAQRVYARVGFRVLGSRVPDLLL